MLSLTRVTESYLLGLGTTQISLASAGDRLLIRHHISIVSSSLLHAIILTYATYCRNRRKLSEVISVIFTMVEHFGDTVAATI